MARNSFVLSYEYYDIIKDLSEKQAGVLIKAIYEYQINGTTANFTDLELRMAFKFIKKNMDFNNKQYEEKCMKNKENGEKGGRPKDSQNAPDKRTVIRETNRLFEEKTLINKDNSDCSKPPSTPLKTERLLEKPKKADNDVDVVVDVEVDNDKEKEVDVKGKEDCKGKNQRVCDPNGKNDPNEETTTAFPFVERPETAKDTANDTSTTRLLNPKSNDTGNGVRTGTGMPEGTKPQTMTSPSETKSPESCLALANADIISSTSVETFKARVEYAKSLGIEEGVARRICNFAQSKKVALCEMHYKGFVGKSGKEAEEAFNLLNFLAKSGKNPSGLKRINSG